MVRSYANMSKMHAVLFLAASLALTAAAIQELKMVCQVRGRTANMSPIDPFLCTHLIYGFVGLHENDVAVLNPFTDVPDQSADAGLRLINAARQKNPSLKIMAAIKQRVDGLTFVQMASNPSSREKFADNVVKFIKTYKLNGVGLYWTYPSVNDTQNYLELLKALRTRFDREGFILTTAVIAPEPFLGVSYDIPQMNKYFDFILLVIYNVRSDWDRTTSFQAPLQASLSDTALKRAMTVEASVAHWLSQGVPREKLVLNVPLSGFSFILQKPEENGVGAPIRDVGAPGPIFGEQGMLSYSEVCEFLKNGDWKIVFDETRRAPYAFKGLQWIAYENVKSVKEKAQFIARLDLGGAMVLNLHFDDINGTCGEKFTLLKTLNTIMRNYGSIPEEVLPAASSKPDTEESSQKCTAARNIRDIHSCGFTTCVPNSEGGYNSYHFECKPGICYHETLGKINVDNVDLNLVAGG